MKYTYQKPSLELVSFDVNDILMVSEPVLLRSNKVDTTKSAGQLDYGVWGK